jgi:RNA polymerase sigma-70 factor, ECF subfamily
MIFVSKMVQPHTPEDDQRLLARMVSGDVAAFGLLLDVYAARVYGLALTILGNRQDAEEVVQETWVQVWKRSSDYHHELGSVASWVLRITRSRSIDRLRSRARSLVRDTAVYNNKHHVLGKGLDPGSSETVADERAGGLANGETIPGMVSQAIGELAPEQREAIEMAFLRGMSRDEIAHAQGVTAGTVKTRIYLGLRRLRDRIGHVPVVHENAHRN